MWPLILSTNYRSLRQVTNLRSYIWYVMDLSSRSSFCDQIPLLLHRTVKMKSFLLLFHSFLMVSPYAWQMSDSAAQKYYSIPACLAWTWLEYTSPFTTVSRNATLTSERTYLKIYYYQVRLTKTCSKQLS